MSLVSLLQEAHGVDDHHAPGVRARQLHGDGIMVAFCDERLVDGSSHGVRVTGNETRAGDQLLLEALALRRVDAVLEDPRHEASLVCVLRQPGVAKLLSTPVKM